MKWQKRLRGKIRRWVYQGSSLLMEQAPGIYWGMVKGQINHTAAEWKDFNKEAAQLYREARLVQGVRELANLWKLARATTSVPGAMAELGVYQGGTAKLLARHAAGRALYLFDTFAGMPDPTAEVDWHLRGDFAQTSLESVRHYVLPHAKSLILVPGRFPESVEGCRQCREERFSFVHLDADLYESTLAGLQFFYPRLSPGGMLVSHDYNSRSCPGVKKAFTEFMQDKREAVIELWDSQCLIIKA